MPQIHLLHENMVDVTKKFLFLFIKPEIKIPERVSHLMKLDVEDVSIQKADKDLSVGQFTTSHLGKARMDKLTGLGNCIKIFEQDTSKLQK